MFGRNRKDEGSIQRKWIGGDREAWLRYEWHGSDARLYGACLVALAKACGDEWNTLSEGEQKGVVEFFAATRPTRQGTYVEALDYRIGLGPGLKRTGGKMLAALEADPEAAEIMMRRLEAGL
ncbi:hypothetical protein ABT084_34880 [Streptomyces sp. NPDC002138]|uniref:hypothetical protein n=1 Tax=Streptomyces sp. NPDC002138 TaxID=3154410 RepID=UPI00332F45E6